LFNNQMIRTLISNSPRPLSFIASLSTFFILVAVLGGCGKDNKPDKGPDGAKKGTVAKTAGSDTTAVTPEFQEAEAVDPQAAYTIRLAPHPGDIYSYRLSMSGATEFQGVKATDNDVYCFTQKVTGVNDDGSFTVEMHYDSITSRKVIPPGVVDSTGRTITFDTRKKVDSTIPDAAQAKALIGKRVNLTISKVGEVREISNIEPVLSAILGRFRDSIAPKGVEQLRQQIKVTLFQAVVQQMFLQNIPDSAIHVASKWSRIDSVPLVLPIAAIPSRAVVVYNLVEVKKVNDALVGRIAVNLATTFPQKSLDDELASATVDAAAAGGSGEMLLDMTTGFPIRKATKIDVSAKITAKAKAGPAKGKTQTLSQRKYSTTLVELLDYKPAPK
jgi:hypothetical protein